VHNTAANDPEWVGCLLLWRLSVQPEGVATFAATLASPATGVVIAIAIALHNVSLLLAFYCCMFLASSPASCFKRAPSLPSSFVFTRVNGRLCY
jgi:hypothetical protein